MSERMPSRHEVVGEAVDNPTPGLTTRLKDLFTWTSILLDTNLLRRNVDEKRTLIREGNLFAEIQIGSARVMAKISGVFDPVNKEYQTISIKDESTGDKLEITSLPRLNHESVKAFDLKGRISRLQSDNMFGTEYYVPDDLVEKSEKIVQAMLGSKVSILKDPRY